MELFGDHQEHKQTRSAARSGARTISSRSRPSRTRETGHSRVKRGRRSTSSGSLHVNKMTKASAGLAGEDMGGDLSQELRSLLPQPSLDSAKEDPSEPQELKQEQPPPSSSVDARKPEGNDDDLFEYVF
jgi:hypothetical protein